ncbi:MAG: hypothetical protein CO078_00135 [Candidatus Nealsonbacteria bacterium CG_4_9_14_0_8_um_filter_36_17]|uniref:Lipoprotein n=2 Tax=Bacteria candidate phyla TaxID=1783234 RepID=A0A2M7VKZ9_9BACT|nr:MAG: hypothetical protein COX73_00325 [bacterium (Candidatus Gribaldobacteria) CG_4_10_14_0_2_um_filter_36_18]PJB99024.1 MAG: hypothetical protein CO078_00135 [Candidatus Nealsonbacteria bacterium CG_4_9_14_0_8_um_filter_36_17]
MRRRIVSIGLICLFLIGGGISCAAPPTKTPETEKEVIEKEIIPVDELANIALCAKLEFEWVDIVSDITEEEYENYLKKAPLLEKGNVLYVTGKVSEVDLSVTYDVTVPLVKEGYWSEKVGFVGSPPYGIYTYCKFPLESEKAMREFTDKLYAAEHKGQVIIVKGEVEKVECGVIERIDNGIYLKNCVLISIQ